MLLPFLPISWPTGKPSGKGMVRRERYMLESETEATIKFVDRRMWVRTEDAEGHTLENAIAMAVLLTKSAVPSTAK